MDNTNADNTNADNTKDRLEYLRGELGAERISYGELAELQSLIPHIEADDVELLQAAGVPEFNEERRAYLLEMLRDGRIPYVEAGLFQSLTPPILAGDVEPLVAH